MRGQRRLVGPTGPGRHASRGCPRSSFYDMTADISERRNVQAQRPEVVQRLLALLQRYVAEAGARPAQRRRTRAHRPVETAVGRNGGQAGTGKAKPAFEGD